MVQRRLQLRRNHQHRRPRLIIDASIVNQCSFTAADDAGANGATGITSVPEPPSNIPDFRLFSGGGGGGCCGGDGRFRAVAAASSKPTQTDAAVAVLPVNADVAWSARLGRHGRAC
jgi:hypothetical protein